jgi:hypothetical protein
VNKLDFLYKFAGLELEGKWKGKEGGKAQGKRVKIRTTRNKLGECGGLRHGTKAAKSPSNDALPYNPTTKIQNAPGLKLSVTGTYVIGQVTSFLELSAWP